MCRPILNTDVLGMWAALTPLPLRSPLAFPFLHDPQGMVKGTKMDFSGLKDDEEIKAVLAYLATFDSDGMVPK
jgi:hypothetical protein